MVTCRPNPDINVYDRVTCIRSQSDCIDRAMVSYRMHLSPDRMLMQLPRCIALSVGLHYTIILKHFELQ